MHIKIKKSIAIFICTLFMISAVHSLSAKQLTLKEDNILEDTSNDEELKTKSVTLYKHGLDGSITPFEVELNIKEGQDLSNIIEEKCKQLFNNDQEFQTNLADLQNNNSNMSIHGDWGILLVSSKGRGDHFKTKKLVSILVRFALLKLKLPRIKLRSKRFLMIGDYSKDPKAKTTIKPLIRTAMGKNATKVIEGNHTVFVTKFSGITTWCGRFSFSPFDILPRAFYGIARCVICVKNS